MNCETFHWSIILFFGMNASFLPSHFERAIKAQNYFHRSSQPEYHKHDEMQKHGLEVQISGARKVLRWVVYTLYTAVYTDIQVKCSGYKAKNWNNRLPGPKLAV